jgi:hypothetical protein
MLLVWDGKRVQAGNPGQPRNIQSQSLHKTSLQCKKPNKPQGPTKIAKPDHSPTDLTEAQNPKHQNPEKLQIPIIKLRCGPLTLELEVWSFTGAWILDFGAFTALLREPYRT